MTEGGCKQNVLFLKLKELFSKLYMCEFLLALTIFPSENLTCKFPNQDAAAFGVFSSEYDRAFITDSISTVQRDSDVRRAFKPALHVNTFLFLSVALKIL